MQLSIVSAEGLVQHRQKLNQLADSSEQEWRTVAVTEQIRSLATASMRNEFRQRTRADGPVSTQTSMPTSQRQGLCFLYGKLGCWKSECLQGDRGVSNNKISTDNVLSNLNGLKRILLWKMQI